MRSGAEQSGSMVSAGAPRGAGQPGQGPPGVSGQWPGGSRTGRAPPALAGVHPVPSSCAHPGAPQLLRAPPAALGAAGQGAGSPEFWLNPSPCLLLHPLTAPGPTACRLCAQAAGLRLQPHSSGIQPRLHPLPCRCGASVGHAGCPGALPAAPGFLGREGRARSPVLCLLSRGHPRVLTAVLVLAARFCVLGSWSFLPVGSL